jgi:hypothetical protein
MQNNTTMTAPGTERTAMASCPSAIDASGEKARWRAKKIQLRYSLSYIKLFELTFKALEDTRPFSPERPAANCGEPAIQSVPPDFDVIVQWNEILKAKIPIIERVAGLLRYAPRQMPHFYTDLRGGPEAAFKWMSSKTRSTLTRKVKRYADFCGGDIRWAMYKTPDEMDTYHRLARMVAEKSYQERLFDCGLPDTAEFRAKMLGLASRNLVRGFLLFHGDQPIAYLYTPAPDGFLIYEYLGYDPKYADQSPGTVLQYLAIKELFSEQRFPLYYWSYGDSQTKRTFSTGEVLGADVYYFRPTLRNRFAVWLHYGVDQCSGRIGNILNRFGLKQRIKERLKGH